MKVNIPNNNINERKYIIDILLGEFLGLEYNIKIKDIENYEIILENGNILVIEDHFFNQFPKDLEYLNEKNIPQNIELVKNEFIIEDDIPIIYGNEKIEIKNNQIICGIDVFASSFFMLSRWEEYVNKTRDIHNRFPAYASLAYKNNYLDRPIVNEYIEMLWNMLKKLDISQNRIKRKFKVILTHDVDDILLFRTYKDLIRKVGGDLVKRKNPILAIKTIFNYIQTKINIKYDPYNSFDWLMYKSESLGLKSYFFFMLKGTSKYDNRYNIDSSFVKELIYKIHYRGHFIGIHPTYNTYNNFKQLKEEKRELETILGDKITFGRQHYLRFEIPITWQIWNDNSMDWDSTCGYAEKEGFRTGVCYTYSVFNILNRKKLDLKEKSLVIMDTTFLTYQSNCSLQQVNEKINLLINKIKKYNGECVVLFHNSNLNNQFIKKIYNYLLKEINA